MSDFDAGDFLKVIELAGKLRSDFVNAPYEFRSITDELRHVAYFSVDVGLYLDDPSETQKQTLESLTRTCNDVLEDVRKLRDKYSKVDPTREYSTSNAPVSERRHVQRLWKRTINPSDIAILRQRLILTITTLQDFLFTITGQTFSKVVQGAVRLNQYEDDRVREEVLEWLTPINYDSEQSDLISQREKGTGQWFLDSPEYQFWIQRDRRTLFCPGIPGAGKTILTSIVVDELTEQFYTKETVGIAYLYCNLWREHDQKLPHLLASLIKQLASTFSSVPRCLTALHAIHNDDGTRPSLQELINTLRTVAGSFSRTFIIIDALDECQTTDGCQSRLISEMLHIQSMCGTNIFATSRFDTYIAKMLYSKPAAVPTVSSYPYVAATQPIITRLEIRASKKDIETFLDGNISKVPASEYWDDQLKDTIKASISSVVDGMFRLAQAYLHSLGDKLTPRAVKKVLESLREQEHGSSASQEQTVLDLVYDDTMKRINKQIGESFLELAMSVLLWITFAERPLMEEQLQHILAVKPDDLDLDTEYMWKIDRMVSVCAGLVTVGPENGIIRLVHHTTRQYLENKQHDLFPDAQYQMAEICATYLTFRTLNSEHNHSFLNDASRYRPLDYLSQHWGRHVCKSGKLGPRVTSFLQNYTALQRLCAVSRQKDMCATPSFTLRSDPTDDDIRAIATHLSSYYGVDIAVKHLLDEGANINSTDDNGRTPLSYAAQNGHEAVVQLLLSRDDVEPDSKDSRGRTPLTYAAENGHEAVVQLLLSHGDVEPDSKDSSGRTPLSYAAKNGHKSVVQLLLSRDDVLPDSKDSSSETPLSYASRAGHEAVIQILLSHDNVLPDFPGGSERTPLSYAAQNGLEAVVQLLLSRDDVVPDSKDSRGRTPLTYAAENGHEAVVQLLLSRDDVVPDSRDRRGRTPLSYAAQNGHEAVVQLLLSHGDVEPDSKDSSGRTPLSYAAQNGHEAIVHLLLSRDDVVPDSRDSRGRTLVSYAAEIGHKAIVQLLLSRNAVPDSPDDSGRTPLSYAAGSGRKAVTRLLLSRDDVEPDSQDRSGKTPLSYASQAGHGDVVQLLRSHGHVLPGIPRRRRMIRDSHPARRWI